jgi:hypothetical protein
VQDGARVEVKVAWSADHNSNHINSNYNSLSWTLSIFLATLKKQKSTTSVTPDSFSHCGIHQPVRKNLPPFHARWSGDTPFLTQRRMY